MKTTNTAKGRKGQKGRDSKYDISFRRKVAKGYLEGTQSTVLIPADKFFKRFVQFFL